jgi:antitoxin (DNA-binding transcriptional repressor) of toxin-antitoxin stability system
MLLPLVRRPAVWVFGLVGAVMLGTIGGAGAWAQEAKPADSALPLKKVVLFNSGVGFYEHSSQLEGDARVDLKFNVENINDLLKSMVLQDLGGGRVSTVTYGSQDPITKTLKTFAIDLTDNPTLAQLLEQVRGEEVRITAPNQIVGKIVGVERRKHKVGDQVVESELLNLLTEDGLRSVSLDTVGQIKLTNPKLDAELRQALTILALGHATDKKTVSLNFLGQGKRLVRVGYIQEAPIWKTSYRLVLKDGEAPFMQGWAIVENTTEADWKDVNLTLVSGRPISFVMDLYRPLYVQRPLVEPELFASLRPQTYNQDLASREQEFLRKAPMAAAAPPQAAGLAMNRAKADEKAAAFGRGFADADRAGDGRNGGAAFNLQQGVQSAAQAGNVGELFQYVIDTPVTLPRQQSAMLPIVNGSVQAEKVSIYNPAVQAKHPLNGLKLTNSTGLHLMQGPITVFDGAAYAGDARIEDLQPNTERLISYALDLDTEVAPESKASPDVLQSVRFVKGVLHTSRKYERSQNYTIKNSGKAAKKVLIEQPRDASWTLTAPAKAEEQTRDQYRFAVKADPGKPVHLAVVEERVLSQQVSIQNLDDNAIRLYIDAKVVSEEVKTALKEVIRRKQQLLQLVAQRNELEQQIKVIDQEQSRIRQNMGQLDRNTDIYKRYVTKFSDQEDKVEKLREQIQSLSAEELKQRKALDDFLIGLNVS